MNKVLDDIVKFYIEKGMKPVIYQSISDEGYFEDIKSILSVYGSESWSESQRHMVLSERNEITPNTAITVRKISEWQEQYGTEIFEKAEEPWEIPVAKKSLDNSNTLFFAAYYKGNLLV